MPRGKKSESTHTPTAAVSKAAPAVRAKAKAPDTELESAIQERAYFIWEEIGRPHGRDVEIWLQAKKELSRKK